MADSNDRDEIHDEEDDKPTVVLDLNALKAQAREQQEELDEIATDLEFNTTPEGKAPESKTNQDTLSLDLEEDEEALELSRTEPLVLLFDHNSDFFSKNKDKFPAGFEYKVISDLKGLNHELQQPGAKAVVFNYNASPKAANQLCAQIKSKFPESRTLIMAKNLSKEKAEAHRKTKSGANGYVSAPFKLQSFKEELLRILE